MTTHQAKADFVGLLKARNIPFAKVTATTVSFEGFGYGRTVFVLVHGAHLAPSDWALLKEDVRKHGKPSEGGYCIENKDAKWL